MNLSGTWKVSVKIGPIWFRLLNLLRNRKVIEGNSGYNSTFGIKWGRFIITQDAEEFIFTYSDSPIIDSVYVIGDKVIGFFYLKKKYVGWFKMTRIL